MVFQPGKRQANRVSEPTMGLNGELRGFCGHVLSWDVEDRADVDRSQLNERDADITPTDSYVIS